MKKVIALSILLLGEFLIGTASFAQYYDVTTQPTQILQRNDIAEAATSNLGSILVGGNGTTLKLMANSGLSLCQTQSISSNFLAPNPSVNPSSWDERNNKITIATNHRSDIAIVTTSYNVDHSTNLDIRLLRNDGSNAKINVATNPVISSALPSPILTWNFGMTDAGEYNHILGLDAALNERYLCLTWMWSRNRTSCINAPGIEYGFAIIDCSNNTWAVTPRNIRDLQFGGTSVCTAGHAAPTVACDRWSDQPDFMIAFVYNFNNRDLAFRFAPSITNTQPDVVQLPIPVVPGHTEAKSCYWVRVVNYNERVGASGYHYFYAWEEYQDAPTNNHYLFSTDGANVSGIISNNIAIIDPIYSLPDAYWSTLHKPTPGTGNGYTDNSTYFVYVEGRQDASDLVTPNTIKICRQWGNDIFQIWPAPLQQLPNNDQVLDLTVGCNQMGIFSYFRYASESSITRYWRCFRPFAQNIYENTLATGLCKLQINQFHQRENEEEIRVYPAFFTNYETDTLRILPENSNQLFKYEAIDLRIPKLSAGIPFASPLEGGLVNYQKRGHILVDAGSKIDFNNINGAQLKANFNGSIMWLGGASAFLNMNHNIIGVEGNLAVQDTAVKQKGVIFMMSPCTINGGSSFYSQKGEVTFKEATAQNDMALLTIDGYQSGFYIDNSMVYLNSRKEDGPLTQIQSNGNLTNATDQTFTIANSKVSTAFQFHSQGAITRPYGYRADIILNAPKDVMISTVWCEYSKLKIINPVATCSLRYVKSFMIENQFELVWTRDEPDNFTGIIEIHDNNFREMWPYHNTSMNDVSGKDIIIYGFDMADKTKVQVHNNLHTFAASVFNPARAYPNTIGISLENGTNAVIEENTVANHQGGIYLEGLGTSHSLICNNWVRLEDCIDCSASWGIKTDAGRGECRTNNLWYLCYGYYSLGDDRTKLMDNDIHDNTVGLRIDDPSRIDLTGINTSNTSYDYPAYNHIHENNETQVELASTENNPTMDPKFGASFGTDNPCYWGHNRFVAVGNQLHFRLASGTDSPVTLSWPLTRNEWSPIIDSTTNYGYTTNAKLPGVSYNNNQNINITLRSFDCTLTPTDEVEDCWEWGNIIAKNDFNEGSSNEDTLSLYNEALSIIDSDPSTALTLIRQFVERYPLAMQRPGVTEGLMLSFDITASLPSTSLSKWNEEYDWLVNIQPLNLNADYQMTVLPLMARSLRKVNRNAAANMWYNFGLLFNDSGNVAYANREIRSIRKEQSYIPEDTTEFYILSFPLKPVNASQASYFRLNPQIRISPNPTDGYVTFGFEDIDEGLASIKIVDIYGQSKTETVVRIMESSEIKLNLSNLPNGSYLAVVNINGSVYSNLVKIIR
jgi:hypothetical protein